MKPFQFAFFLLLASVRLNALAAEFICPDLKAVVQVGVCPTPEQLQYTFIGYCSDDTKAYRGETDVCTDFQNYRQLKNVALWESADGVFDAYVSCDLPKDQLQRAKVSSIKLGQKSMLTQLVCNYDNDVQFTYRTRAQCKLSATADCSANPATCKASCE